MSEYKYVAVHSSTQLWIQVSDQLHTLATLSPGKTHGSNKSIAPAE